MTRLSCEPEDPTLYEDVEEESKEEVPFEMKIYQEAKACSQAIQLVENSLNNQIESLKKAEEMQKKLVKQMLGAGVDMQIDMTAFTQEISAKVTEFESKIKAGNACMETVTNQFKESINKNLEKFRQAQSNTPKPNEKDYEREPQSIASFSEVANYVS